MISRFELHIALRYLRSRRASRLLSLITVIAVGGVTVGVLALIVVLGVMNGLQADLRDKILVAQVRLEPVHHAQHHDRSEEHTSELQSLAYLVCRLLLEKKKKPYRTVRETQSCAPPHTSGEVGQDNPRRLAIPPAARL